VIDATHLGQLNAQQLRETVLSLAGTTASQAAEIERKDREIAFKQAFIDKLTHEMAVLKRLKFAAQSEAYSAEQKSLLEETIDTDLAALAAEIEQAEPPPQDKDDKQKPKRQALPAKSTTNPRTPPVPVVAS
jgi:transposase